MLLKQYIEHAIEKYPESTIFSYISTINQAVEYYPDILFILGYNKPERFKEKLSDMIISNRAETNREDKHEMLSLWLSKSVFQDLENNKAYIGLKTEPRSESALFYNKMASAIHKIIPWCFSEHPITEEEYCLLESIGNGDFSKFEKLVKEWEAKNKLNSIKDKIALKSFFKVVKDSKKQDLINNKTSKENSLENYMAEISRLLIKIKEIQLQILAFENLDNEDYEDASEFLCTCENISIHKNDERRKLITFKVVTSLDVVDLDLFENLMENFIKMDRVPSLFESWKNGHSFPKNRTKKFIKFLFEKLWKEKEIKLNTTSFFTLPESLVAEASRPDSFYGNFANTAPHPHLYQYRCMGDYSSSFVQLAKDGDLVGILNTMVVSSKCLNLSDTSACSALSTFIFSNSYKCFEYEGEAFTLDELFDFFVKKGKFEDESAAILKDIETKLEKISETFNI